MLKYIIRDLSSAFRYLPYGLAAGMLVAVLLGIVNDHRVRRKRRPFSVAATTCFFMYVVILLFITFWSRETGSRQGIDLELFSTWGINDRNNAFVVENVLLFIPYGFVCAWAIPPARGFLACLLLGLATCVGIEYMQLITQRGYFQIDDVITNTIGAVIGWFLFCCVPRRAKKDREKDNSV